MKEIKKLPIHDGYEFDRVENGEVILKKKEVVLPKTWNECNRLIGSYYYPNSDMYVNKDDENAINALCRLLICRNACWKQLGWKPDWKDDSDKYCIFYGNGRIESIVLNSSNRILAFPDMDTAEEFYEAFKDLIEEAKELL